MRARVLVIVAALAAAATPRAEIAPLSHQPDSDVHASATRGGTEVQSRREVESGHEVTYDRFSMLVDGERFILQTGEFHYFRLPSPDLWRDALEKIRAAGFNGVSLYFDWAYHSPKRDVYDFTGVRDVDRLLDLIDELGLYAVVRPGPYINAETTGGGFPAWLKGVDGRARSDAPGYRAAYRGWTRRINAIIADHQLTEGTGTVVAYNVENEYAVNVSPQYMEDLQADARADGITVPIVHNNCCGGFLANWSEGQGAVEIPGVDDYPQSFECQTPDVWGAWGDGVTRRLLDDVPVYAAEYQAGAIDLNNAGYDACRQLTNTAYMKVFYKSNLITSGATMFGYYMAYGGTSWGWLPQPNDVYTSYDYGAAITENRQLTGKYDEFKRQGYFLQSVTPLAETDPVAAPVSDNDAVYTEARANPDTGTQFVLVRHPDRGASTDDSATLDWTTPDGRYDVPVRVRGRDADVLVAGYDMGGQRLVWSTSEILTHAAFRGRDVAVLYGAEGIDGSTMLRYGSEPSVRVLSGDVESSYDASTGDLRLDYTHAGLARVLISGGGRRPMLLLLGTDEEAANFWRVETGAGPVLVRGTSLMRSTQAFGPVLSLRADTAEPGPIEVFAPCPTCGPPIGHSWPAHRSLVVNGRPVAVHPTPSGSLAGWLPGPREVTLPELTGWRTRAEAPEAEPGFDDSRWTVADHPTSPNPMEPMTLPVLYSDDYGFHYGHVWYRGHFTATGDETSVRLNAITGRRGIHQVWLNGRYLGSADGATQMDTDPDNPNPDPDPGRGDFAIPSGLLDAGEPAVLAVLVSNMGHNDDWIANDYRFKQPRGLIGASVVGSEAPIAWRIQGTRGGEDLVDRTRGPLNNGGLYGERAGWHLPGYPDRSWQPGSPSTDTVAPGVAWYRTSFRLDLPQGQDVPLTLRFEGEPSPDVRALIFLNGWNLGQYGGDIGPQRDFALPAGILRQHGRNTLALAVVAEAPGAVGPVSLAAAGNHWGGVRVRDVPSPGYEGRKP